ncbi:GNAT family N-acetyltransferase [Gammaproteobacteria bacterium]
MITELLNTVDPRWNEVLASIPHDFYHLPGYIELEAIRMGGVAGAIYIEEDGSRFLQPVVLRELPFNVPGLPADATDASSPYGYPGPLIDARNGFMETLKTALPRFMRERHILSLFVRLNPLLNDPALLTGLGNFVAHGEVIWIDLTLAPEELHRQTRSRYRSYLKKMKSEGVTVDFDENYDLYQTFIKLYYATMNDVGADEMYYFDTDYFERLREILGANMKLVVVKHEGIIAAMGLFMRTGSIVQYHLSGKNVDSGQPHATKAMMVFVRDWAKSVGAKILNLGGGIGSENDNLSQFKRGFSELTRPFYTWRLIGDSDYYDTCVKEWSRRACCDVGATTGFFPSYRKPMMGS